MFEEQREYYLTSERTANLLGTGFELLATRLNVNKTLSLLRRGISLIPKKEKNQMEVRCL
jgi:hypothetical protein